MGGTGRRDRRASSDGTRWAPTRTDSRSSGGDEAAVTGADRVTGPDGCNDGGVPGRPPPRHLSPRHLVVAAVVSFGALAAGCGRQDATAPPPVDQRAASETLSTNPFIPDDVNIGDCVSSLPRPGCGNEIRGDSHSLLTFGVLAAGLAFIGWRISRSVRRRDAPRPAAGPPSPTSPTSTTPTAAASTTAASTSAASTAATTAGGSTAADAAPPDGSRSSDVVPDE